ncbi:MAG: epimerase, partial [Verrucomicrobia bacterium]
MQRKPRIVLAGGSGFLGKTLAKHFIARDCDAVVLTRSARAEGGPGRWCGWDGRTPGDWATELDGATAVVNLAGRSVNCRYNGAHRREILESRLQPTRVLAQAIGRCARPPRVWLNSSTATIYQHTFGPAW